MADTVGTPESTVYWGREGTGAAQIFGREGDPLRPLQMLAANKAKQRQLDDERQRQAKIARDKRMLEIMNADPEKTFAPFNQQVANLAEEHRMKGVEFADRGGDVDSPDFIAWNKSGWDKINDAARRGIYVQDTIKEVTEQLKANPYYAGNMNFYNQKMLDLYMSPDGSQQGIPLDKVDVNKLRNVIVDNPEGFDLTKYSKDFMKNVEENVFSYLKNKMTNYGLETDNLKVKIKGELYTPDENTVSGVKEDAEGNPIINATPQFINSFLASDGARRAVEKKAATDGLSVKEAVESLVRPEGGHKLEIENKGYRDPEWYVNLMRGNSAGIGMKDVPHATDRWSKIKSVVNAFGTDGKVTPEARAALGEIKKNLKMSGGDVLDADFLEGTNTPGMNKFIGVNVENKPYDRLVFRVRRSGDRRDTAVEINLDDEGAMAELNGAFEQSKAEGGRHFSVDQLQKLANEKWTDIKLGREGRTQAKEMEKANENAVVTKWQAGEDLDMLEGMMHDGKPIKNVKINQVSTGMMPWSKEKVLDIEYEDGTYGEAKMDYDTLAQIRRGQSKAKPAAEPVEVDAAAAAKFDSEWAKAKKGDKVVGPDGITYIKQ